MEGELSEYNAWNHGYPRDDFTQLCVCVWKATLELFEEPLVRYVPLAVLTWCFIR